VARKSEGKQKHESLMRLAGFETNMCQPKYMAISIAGNFRYQVENLLAINANSVVGTTQKTGADKTSTWSRVMQARENLVLLRPLSSGGEEVGGKLVATAIDTLAIFCHRAVVVSTAMSI
jgi:hypothetical protein